MKRKRGQMHNDSHDDVPAEPRFSDDWIVPVSIALAILISIIAFVWLFLQLDPYISDFISGNDSATPEATTTRARHLAGVVARGL